MNATMSFQAKHELLERITARYRLGSRKQKRMILDEFIESTGYARKYAIRLLGEPGDAAATPITRQRFALVWAGCRGGADDRVEKREWHLRQTPNSVHA